MVISGPMVTPVSSLILGARRRRLMSRPPTTCPPACPRPVAEPDGLDTPYWEGTRAGRAAHPALPRAAATWQWGPEWICHHCLSFDIELAARGGPRAASTAGSAPGIRCTRRSRGIRPYIVVLVELPDAGDVRMLGNLLGDPHQEVRIGAPVEAVFEPHDDAKPPFTLVHWRGVDRTR